MTTATASLLLRLSGASTDDNTGLRTQKADLEALAARHGLTIVAIHTDDGLSGALRNRPGFLRWLADAREGRAAYLLAWKLDRVSRGGSAGLARFLDVLEGVNDAGEPSHAPVTFLSAADGLDSRLASWDLQAAVLGALAKGERDAIRTRVLAHRERARAEGKAVGGRRPWAFRTVPRDGGGSRREPIPAHAEAIRWALEHLRAGGSLSEIPREWSRRGLAPKGSTKHGPSSWHLSPVRRILSNPNLYGATTHHGALLRNGDGTARIDPDQAILTLPEWAELQALLDGRSTARNAPEVGSPALLAGILHCGSCHRVMYPHRPTGRTWTYRCRGGAGCDRPTSVVMEYAESFLVSEFHRLVGDAPRQAASWTPDRPEVDPEEAARLTEALSATESLLAGDLDDADALAALQRRRELRSRLAALQDAASQPASGWLEADSSGLTFGEAYDAAATIPECTELLTAAFDRVTVAPSERLAAFDPNRLSW